MRSKIKEIYPDDLSGPRSFFTDIDPADPNYNQTESVRKLKLQLLTKEKIVVAASSLFHDIWLKIFKEYAELIPALEGGIIIPAIRNEFEGVGGFFDKKSYGEENRSFFIKHATHSVPWDLQKNTQWFKKHFFNGLIRRDSLLRKKGGIKAYQANAILENLEDLIKSEKEGLRFLQRKHIEKTAKKYDKRVEQFLINYSNLLYRLSGSRVVNSESHFPQSNVTKLEIVGNEKLLSDDSVFWDIYAETVFTYLGTAVRLTPERLDNLSFKDILVIRRSFFDKGFSLEYDNLIGRVKKETRLSDPEKLILHMQEISGMAVNLKKAFSKRVQSELSVKDTSLREKALWQVANVLSIISGSSLGLLVGVLSSLKSIPEITAPVSSRLTRSLNNRLEWMSDFVNSKVGWSDSQRKAFLDAYRELAIYGLK